MRDDVFLHRVSHLDRPVRLGPLLNLVFEQGQPTAEEVYDGAGRLVCSTNPQRQLLQYDDSGRRTRRYWLYSAGNCQTWIANPDNVQMYKRATYTYDGYRLMTNAAENCGWGNCTPNSIYSRTFQYDEEGNLTRMQHINGSGATTLTLEYVWEPKTHLMTGLTRKSNATTDYTMTVQYDSQKRIQKACYWGGSCQTFAYVGDTDWISTITNQVGTVTHRYLYANGRPLSVYAPSQPIYFRYDFHGDTAGGVTTNGDGIRAWNPNGPWGENYDNLSGQPYNWNGGWGYWHFDNRTNTYTHDYIDIGLYYTHGRWYNPDTALWLSPDEKGEYFYGSGQDAVNWVWQQLQLLWRVVTAPWYGRGQACGLNVDPSCGRAVPSSPSLGSLLKAGNKYGQEKLKYNFGPPGINPEIEKAIELAAELGQWVAKNESMSPEAREYQEYVTKRTGEVFRYNDVDFDGINDKALLDAKDNYRDFIDPETGRFEPWFKGANRLVNDARRQIEAARDAPIEWHFYQKDSMEAVRKLFEDAGVQGIDLVYDPGPVD